MINMRAASLFAGWFLAGAFSPAPAALKKCEVDPAVAKYGRSLPLAVIKRDGRLLNKQELEKLVRGRRMTVLFGMASGTFSIDFSKDGSYFSQSGVEGGRGRYRIESGKICMLSSYEKNNHWECDRVYVRPSGELWLGSEPESRSVVEIKMTQRCIE